MQPDTHIYSPATSVLALKVIVIVSNRIRTPTFQTKLDHYADCDIQINQPARCISLSDLLPVV
jgi:hypothetical protein